jgi:DNA-binding beta-propeller fold protein YncE
MAPATSGCSTGATMMASTASGILVAPKGIGITGGYIWVSDTNYDVVWKLSMSGTFAGCMCQAVKSGSGNGEFIEPGSIATDPSTGALYVVDGGNNRVQVFKSTGTFVSAFGTAGSAAGQFTTPSGIALSAAGNVYVPDSLNRVQKWVPYSKQTTVPAPDPTRATTTVIYHVPVS